eukprot:403331458
MQYYRMRLGQTPIELINQLDGANPYLVDHQACLADLCGLNLIELHIARFYRAQKWLLSSVNSQMIKQVVPLSKKFSATVVIARKNFGLSPRCCARVFNQRKQSGIRHMYFGGKRNQIYIFSRCPQTNVYGSEGSFYRMYGQNVVYAEDVIWLLNPEQAFKASCQVG